MMNAKHNFTVNQAKRARILLRVSSNQQLDEGGDLFTQRNIVEEYIAKHPEWNYDGTEYFEGGVSGYKNSIDVSSTIW